MKLYLDTGNVSEISYWSTFGLVDGITTNPSLIAKEGREFIVELKEILTIMKQNASKDFTLSAEVTQTTSLEEILRQARSLVKLSKKHILIKIPMTPIGLQAVSILSKEGVRCNVTLIFSISQAILAAKAGAWCVSPFIGRLDDSGVSGVEIVKSIQESFSEYGFATKVLAASIRSKEHIEECQKFGCDMATIPPKIYEELFHHELTTRGLEKFEADWEQLQKKLKE